MRRRLKPLMHYFIQRADLSKRPAFCCFAEGIIIVIRKDGFATGVAPIFCPGLNFAGVDQHQHKGNIDFLHHFLLGSIITWFNGLGWAKRLPYGLRPTLSHWPENGKDAKSPRGKQADHHNYAVVRFACC